MEIPAKDSRRLKGPQLAETTILATMGCAGNRFQWKGEIVGRVVSEKSAEAEVGRNPSFPLDLTFYRADYTVNCLCANDTLTVIDDDLEKYDLNSLKETSLTLPPGKLTDKQKKDVFEAPFFKDIGDNFKVIDIKVHAESKGTCGIFKLALTLQVADGFKTQLGRKGGGGFGINVADADYKVRVRSVFKVCCCTSEAEDGKAPECSWSSKCLVFETEEIQGKLRLSGLELKWQLNGKVGGCGKVTWKEKLTGFY